MLFLFSLAEDVVGAESYSGVFVTPPLSLDFPTNLFANSKAPLYFVFATSLHHSRNHTGVVVKNKEEVRNNAVIKSATVIVDIYFTSVS